MVRGEGGGASGNVTVWMFEGNGWRLGGGLGCGLGFWGGGRRCGFVVGTGAGAGAAGLGVLSTTGLEGWLGLLPGWEAGLG